MIPGQASLPGDEIKGSVPLLSKDGNGDLLRNAKGFAGPDENGFNVPTKVGAGSGPKRAERLSTHQGVRLPCRLQEARASFRDARPASRSVMDLQAGTARRAVNNGVACQAFACGH